MDNAFYIFGFEKWVLRKLGCAFFCLILVQCVVAKNLFLVSATLGNGAMVRSANGSTNLERATYLPLGMRVTVGPRSGLETLASGRTLRFGSQTTFIAEEERFVVHEGSLLYRTRKMGSVLMVKGPEVDVSLDGMGTLLLGVEPNGGFKLVGLLGRIRVTNQFTNRATQLLPGELLFVKPGSHGFGDKVFVNLKKLAETSFLVGGFDNLSSFGRSLASVSQAQHESIAKRYRAEVGDARGVNTFEIVPITSASEEINKPEPAAPRETHKPVQLPSADGPGPLEELLGRSPKRFSPQAKGTVAPASLPAQVSPAPVPHVTTPASDPLPPSRRIVSESENRVVFENEKGQLKTELIFRGPKSPSLPIPAVPSLQPVVPVASPEAKPADVSPARKRLPGRLFETP